MDVKERVMRRKIGAAKVMLTDLLKVNTDRVERYKRAGYNILDSELKSVFYAIADESRKNLTDINTLILKCFGEEPSLRPVATGKIYRAWLDVKSKFNGTTHNNLLNSCEFGELAAFGAYTMARNETDNATILELLNRQQETLKSSMDIIKSYRQSYDKINKVPR